jgi:murein L,D-transpeptidase YafK
MNTCLLVGTALLLSFHGNRQSFKAEQLKSGRVQAAYKKWPVLQELLSAKKISATGFDLYLRSFKLEGQLEIWIKNKSDKTYQLLKTVPVCASSGTLGPKRRQGDGQVPEGFYEISSLNPYSSYHLSLKVGYPNKSDRLKALGKDPGGDIMIHGKCVTIGCIPIQDRPVEELYVLCVEARNRGSAIFADIYPCRLEDKKLQELSASYDASTITFWNSLKKSYAYFELHHRLPKISTDKAGNYLVEPTAI